MKSLNQVELKNLVDELTPQLVNAQLQEVYADERGLVLGLYLKQSFWLILDLQMQTPFIACTFSEKSPWPKTRLTRPAGLFLNSHGKNLYLTEFSVRTELGRVVEIVFQNKMKICELEMHLIPRRTNLRITSEGKSISWLPWKSLDQHGDESSAEEENFRAPDQLFQEWMESQKKPQPKANPVSRVTDGLKKDLKKKVKAIDEIQSKILKNEADSQILYALGESLKVQALENFKNTDQGLYLDFKKSSSWNREHCFSQAKTNLKKNEGARLRLETLRKEIQSLEKKIIQIESGEKPAESDLDLSRKHKISLADENLKARKKTLSSGAVVYMGKSAKDNLALLRRARAWDYWLHLRDYPGAHAIIHREKNQNILPKDLQEISRWLAEESLSAKSLQSGTRLSVVLAEVRFVRPIKGDKAGRVNYHSEKILHFTYE